MKLLNTFTEDDRLKGQLRLFFNARKTKRAKHKGVGTPPLPSQVCCFALASSSFAILSARLTIEEQYEKKEGCTQSRDNLSSHSDRLRPSSPRPWTVEGGLQGWPKWLLFLFSGLAEMNDFKFCYFEILFFALHCYLNCLIPSGGASLIYKNEREN